jgi:uracil-DNA glycosylase
MKHFGFIMPKMSPIILWKDLQNEIINCRRCPRLVRFREEVAREKRRQFRDFDYWGRPVPSNGSIDARLVIVGLAPAGHGGNRTGRMFTGDGSAKFLFRHLYLAGFVNQPSSDHREDGQKLVDCYITAVAHCVPPDNKLRPSEIENCSQYLAREFGILQNPKAILALGRVAFDSIIDFARTRYEVKGRFTFQHGKKYRMCRDFPLVFASYHPSPRNTQTGKLTSRMFMKVLSDVRTSLQS